MSGADGYREGGFHYDRVEATRVRALIETELLPVFDNFFIEDGVDGGEWAYELVDRRDERVVSQGEYSSSTNAMILFALATVSGRLHGSPLSPRAPLSIRSPDALRLAGVIQRGLSKLVRTVGRNGFETSSATFGRNDPFTIAWLLELLSLMPVNSGSLNTPLADRLRAAVIRVATDAVTAAISDPQKPHLHFVPREDRPPDRQVLSQPLEHSFPLLRLVQIHRILQRLSQPTEARLWLTGRYFLDRLHTHLSLNEISDSPFDPAELAFSLEGALICNEDGVGRDVIDRTFRVFADTKQQFWRATRPAVVSPRGQIQLPISVEICNSLLRICDLVDDSGQYFSLHVDLFKRYAAWLFSRLVRGEAELPNRAPTAEIQASLLASSAPDPVTPTHRRFAGWHSEHIDDPAAIHLWYTSQAMVFLASYAAMLRIHLGRRSLESVGLSVAPPKKKPGSWTEVVAKFEPSASRTPEEAYRFYAAIGHHYVTPRLEPGSAAGREHYSMLLYGPPGTGKTAAAESLAAMLDYRLIEITPSDFIRLGESEVEARAKAIFETLREQSQAVILFDEIDRMILDRDSKMYQNQSDVFQFMTPGMLTKLKDLHERKQCIFVIATNYAERIDRAIKRRGRIDDQYLVLPPDRDRRVRILAELLSPLAVFSSRDKDALRGDLTPIADATALCVYTELKQLVDEASTGTTTQTAERVLAALRSLAEKFRPLITLMSYRSRFRRKPDDPDFAASDEPIEEFLTLIDLVLEVGDIRTNSPEWNLVKEVGLSHKEDSATREEIDRRLVEVQDGMVRARLLAKFEEWRWIKR